MPYTTVAHINSLKGEVGEITVLEQVGDNDYIVDYCYHPQEDLF